MDVEMRFATKLGVRLKSTQEKLAIDRIGGDNGTILLIAPVILLITITLASLVLDLNALYTAKTALQDRIESIASAASNQVSPTDLYEFGNLQIDQRRASNLIANELSNQLGDLAIEGYQVSSTADSVCIRASATFALPALAPIVDSIITPTVQATAIAILPNPTPNSPSTTICTP